MIRLLWVLLLAGYSVLLGYLMGYRHGVDASCGVVKKFRERLIGEKRNGDEEQGR